MDVEENIIYTIFLGSGFLGGCGSQSLICCFVVMYEGEASISISGAMAGV